MSDDRTSEQKAADDNLTRAVQQTLEAYGDTEPGGVMANYLVVVEQRAWDGSGQPVTGVTTLLQDGQIPWPNIIGLLRMAQLRYENDWVRA